MIEIRDDLQLDESELTFTATRSGGPGGQHVNKVSTSVTLRFDVRGSEALSEEQRALILDRLATRIGKDGVLRVTSRRSRSQWANRRAALERFVELLHEALERSPERRARRVPAAERRRRLEDKRRRSRVKRERGPVGDDGS